MYLYAIERGADGYPKLKLPESPTPTPREVFERFCFLNAVSDPEQIERLWQEKQQAAREKAAKESPKQRRQQRKAGRR